MIKIYTDAAYQPKTKQVGIGIIIQENKEQLLFKYMVSDIDDNHLGEFIALLLALKLIKQSDKQDTLIQYLSDSQIVIDSLRKGYVHNPSYKDVLVQIINYLQEFPMFFPQWISESNNRGADTLSKQALHQYGTVKKILLKDLF